MAAPLPLPVRLKLDQTLAQWRHWDCGHDLPGAPRFVRALSAGHSNHSMLVAASRHFVVRIDGVDPAIHGINRQAEWLALRDAHAAGLAPRPCYFNPELGTLVCEYLPPDAGQQRPLAEVADLLRAIHRLPLRHSRLDLRRRILRYENLLRHHGRSLPAPLTGARERVTALLASAAARDRPRALCHNDLLQGNRLASGGRLWAIDWEYCAVTDPLYDLAVVICGDELSNGQAQELVGHYLAREPDAGENRLLLEYICIYRYLALLWYLAQRHPAMDTAQCEQVLAQLLESLAEAGASP